MKRKGILVCGIMLSALAVGLSGCGKQQGKDASEVAQGNVAAGLSVHDPSIVKADGNYYIFGSHM